MNENEPFLETEKLQQATKLQKILDMHKDERVVVVGPTCVGKTTFLENIKEADDMDELVFPQLTKEESDYACNTPWTPEVGEAMTKLTKEHVIVEAGRPVFGTVVLDADLAIYLKISDDLLRERTLLRVASFDDAKNMQKQIESELNDSGIPFIEFDVG
jgi:hypothetical protein